MSPPGRVILTYGRSLMALVIARSLASRGIEVIGCDDIGLTVLSFSKHVKETFTVAPWESEPVQFLADLEAAVLEYAPTDGRPYVLMPAFREIELIARHRDRFEPTIKVAAPTIESIGLVNPKHHLAELVQQHRIDAPRAWSAESEADLRTLAPKLSYPLIVKPVDGVGGRGVSCARSAEDMIEQARAIGFDPPALLQEFCEGEDYCVAVLAKAGAVQAIMAYQNLLTFPREAGAGASRETVDEAPFRACVDQLMAATNWDGLAQLDFRWSGRAEDKPKLIEVNARFWAGIFHSVETGPDFPWLLYQQTIGEPVVVEDITEIGARTKTPGVWLAAAIEDVAVSDPHFAAASEAWSQAKRNLANGEIIKAVEKAGAALGESLSISEAAAQLKASLSELRGAPSELSDARDPLIGLGALFVISSLVRHGKLPPEITYKTAEAATPRAGPPKPRDRPFIGVTKPDRGDHFSWLAMKFAIWLAGGAPVKLTARAPRDPHTIDGLVFGGGSDVYPMHYQATPKENYRYDLARSEMEASWAITARHHDLPVLGVCRGAQMLNVLAGGTLHADLSSFKNVHRARDAFDRLFKRKPVRVRARSRLGEILGKTELCVNAIHEQAIDRLGAGLSVSAREPNGIVQAMEDGARRFWIGVQFHPELLIYHAPYRRLFKALVEAAKARAAERMTEADTPLLTPDEAPAKTAA
jgi:gamma-glutamyl-gamma-aminobutyrate hydrolase PuuD/predicted ATP-grasp superfamily ATP-dependent carboligase